MSPTIAIRGINLCKSYNYYEVLKNISFELSTGRCYALFGPNGSGKTTLLKILATLQRPSSGRFEILGRDGVTERMAARTRSYLIAHGSYLYDELNANENIRFSLGLRGLAPTPSEVKRVLDRVKIGAFAELKCRYYSEGMKKRMALAKAMLAQPTVLLMDEAYASLDEHGMTMVSDFIREMKQAGSAIFMTTHDRVKAAEVADQVGVLRRGELHHITIDELKTAHELF